MHRWMLAGAVASFGLAGSAPAQTPAAASRPNVVLIVADDLGHADLGCQQQSKDVRTPRIDSLATGGVRFTQAYVTAPVCSPSRAGLLTGRYQQRFGHELNPGTNAPENFGLPADQVMLPKLLKDAGYATGMLGKWHLGFRPEMHPQSRGFDEFFGFLGGGHDYFDPKAGLGDLSRGRESVGEEKEYFTDAFGREAASFVDRHAADGRPFFLYVAFNAVHSPMQAPPKYVERFKDVPDEKRRTYLGMLSAMDDAVGRVLDTLRERRLDENTLVIFVSDNGGPTGETTSRNDPFRGNKGSLWEGGIHVPMIVRWPGRVPAGKTFDAPAIALDVFQTALAAARVAPPADRPMDGVDLLPFVSGAKQGAPHEALFWRSARQYAVREGTLKLHRPGAQAGQPPKLFDLSVDAGEQNDLSAARPADVERLQRRYDAWATEMIEPLWQTRGGTPEWRTRMSGATGPASRPVGGD